MRMESWKKAETEVRFLKNFEASKEVKIKFETFTDKRF